MINILVFRKKKKRTNLLLCFISFLSFLIITVEFLVGLLHPHHKKNNFLVFSHPENKK